MGVPFLIIVMNSLFICTFLMIVTIPLYSLYFYNDYLYFLMIVILPACVTHLDVYAAAHCDRRVALGLRGHRAASGLLLLPGSVLRILMPSLLVQLLSRDHDGFR